MTRFTVTTPVEVDIDLDEHLPAVSTRILLAELNERLVNNITITRAQFLDLADAIVEMRFSDAFALMEAAAPHLVNADQAHNAQLDRILAKARQEEAAQ